MSQLEQLVLSRGPWLARLGEHLIAAFLAVAAAALLIPEFDALRVSEQVHRPFVGVLFLAAVLAAAAAWYRMRRESTSEAVLIFLAFAALAGIYSPHALLEGRGPDPVHLVFGPASRATFGLLLIGATSGLRLPRAWRRPPTVMAGAAVLIVGIDLVLHSSGFRSWLTIDPVPRLRGLEWIAVVAQVVALTAMAVRWRRAGSRFLGAVARAMAMMLLSSLLFLASKPWMLRWWVAHLGLIAAAALLVGAVVVGRARRGSLAAVVDVDVASSIADLLIGEMSSGLAIVDHRGELVGWNDAARDLTGWDHETADERFPRGNLPDAVVLGDATVRAKQVAVDRLGHPLRVSFLVDATREMALSEENDRLDQLTTELEAAIQAKNELVGMVSHELRTPLTAVLGFARVLVARVAPNLDEMEALVLERIEAVSAQMATIVDDLLTISAIEDESFALTLDRQPCDLSELVREVVDVNRATAERKQISFALQLPDGPLAATADRGKIDQVLTNLLTNAVKFSQPGTTVTVRLEEVGGRRVIAVQDQGPGIPDEEQQNLFEPFGRTSVRPTGDERSTGLGLAIVRRIVEGHGGRIEVFSTVGVGSTFVVTLPREPAIETAPASEAGAQVAGARDA